MEDEKRWVQASYEQIQQHTPASSRSFTLDEWTWALDLVRSRTFKVGNKYVMCPLMDLCNHASAARTSAMTYDDTLDCYQLQAGMAAAAGQEILISYGALCNDHLLAFYGFVEVDNPWDTVVLSQERMMHLIEGLEGADAACKARDIVEQLERYRYIQPGAACQILAGPGPHDPPTVSVELSMVWWGARVAWELLGARHESLAT